MADLKVDVDGLENVANALRGVADGLDDTDDVIDGAESAFGSGDVVDALRDFDDHWSDGRGRIKDNMNNVEKLLDEAVKQYRAADTQLTDALKKDQTETKNVQAR